MQELLQCLGESVLYARTAAVSWCVELTLACGQAAKKIKDILDQLYHS